MKIELTDTQAFELLEKENLSSVGRKILEGLKERLQDFLTAPMNLIKKELERFGRHERIPMIKALRTLTRDNAEVFALVMGREPSKGESAYLAESKQFVDKHFPH